MQIKTAIPTIALAAAGAGLWAYAGSQLAGKRSFDYTPNPLGIKQSPYGQVIAMAIQAPIDADWHARFSKAPEHEAVSGDESHNTSSCEESCCSGSKPAAAASSSGKLPLLARLDSAASGRTNPRPPTPAHDFYLRREVEKRLHFAWSLDPSNYANYHSYHLFLSESSVGTAEVLKDGWMAHGIAVARFTIDYCLRENNDPRPALTAAAAAANALELMLFQKDTRPETEFREMLSILDHSLARHVELSNAWVESGAWANLSAARQQEVDDRFGFLTKVREANAEAIQRIAESGTRNVDLKTSESETTARNSSSPITDH